MRKVALEQQKASLLAVIQYTLSLLPEDGQYFLTLWDRAEFPELRKEFPNAPEAVYIGSDASHPETLLR